VPFQLIGEVVHFQLHRDSAKVEGSAKVLEGRINC